MATRATESAPTPLPFAERPIADMPGHWLLAHLGKRVLRPGGAELTTTLVAGAPIAGSDVVEFAPGLGRTAALIVAAGPRSYHGVDQDEAAVANVAHALSDYPTVPATVHHSDAHETGLPTASADVVLGEAMLSMQTDRGKRAIMDEARRILRPGGRYVIHELGLTPDDLDPDIKTAARKDLARAIKVNARPLTVAEWRDLLAESGFEVESVAVRDMALLRLRRMIADEGLRGAGRIAINVARNPAPRRRVLGMRRAFGKYKKSLIAVGIIARAVGD